MIGELRLVAGREVREAIRRKAYWIITGILFVASTALVVLPEVLAEDETRVQVAVHDAPAGFGPILEAIVASSGGTDGSDGDEPRVLELEEVADAAAVRAAVDEGDADVGLQGGADPILIVRSGRHERLLVEAQQALAAARVQDRLAEAGLTGAQIATALGVEPAEVEGLDVDREERRAVAAVSATALYLLLLAVMSSVGSGVAAEKANRISEVLLAVVRPGSLLFGKVIGLCTTGAITAAVGALPFIAKVIGGFELPAGSMSTLAASGIGLVLGAALLAMAAGALGALVERQEQAGSAMAPLSLTLIVGYFVAQTSPDSPLAAVLAYVPLTAPMVEPARIAVGEATALESALSLAIGVVALVVTARVGSLVYRRAIVRTGQRLKLREVLRPAT